MMTLATEMVGSGAHWGSGAWWPIFPLFWVLFWGVVVFMVIRFRRSGRWQQGDSAEGVLAERYARGEISVDEYRERMGVLKERS